MKKENNKILLYLGVVSLIIILAVVTIGTLQGRYTFFFNKNKGSIVLGIADKLPLKNLSSQTVENALSNAVNSTREELTKKAIDAEVTLKSNIEKELSEFTSSQIKSIQTKICQDWGITASNSGVTD